MDTNKKEKVLELFCFLMEKSIFLASGITPKNVAELCNCKLSILNGVLEDQLGFSIKQILALYRVQYARELLLAGVGYEFACKYSGIRSIKELEEALEYIDN